MNKFEEIKAKNIDELIDWIDEYFSFDSAPYWKWWDEKYCSKCWAMDSSDDNEIDNEIEIGYCEMHDNCRFFKNMDNIPNSKQVIKMWLMSEEE